MFPDLDAAGFSCVLMPEMVLSTDFFLLFIFSPLFTQLNLVALGI